MNLLEIVREARSHLKENGRLSLRMLRRQFELEDEALEDVIEELVEVQRVAVRDGAVLNWVGAERAPSPPVRAESSADEALIDRSPSDYTPRHLAQKILQSRSALEGERKHVTVLFADVKGSMQLAEGLDPEAWHGILDRFFQIMTDGVHRYEGTVNQYTGDGVMALFGAPIAHEDHPQRACYAALQLHDELSAHAREVKREHGLQFATRMGIHTGEVVVGKIGDDLRMDYTAQGHTVGLAARMEALASADTVYLTDTTARRVEGLFELEDLGDFNVRGVGEPIRAFELRGLGALRTRFDVSRARGLTRFVGRTDDLQVLESALGQAAAGNGQVVGIVAQAGTGKSRLCFEFVERCRGKGLTVLEGQAVAHGKNVPLLPILQVFRAYFGIAETDDPRTTREKIAGRLLLLDPAFAELLPIVFDFFGAPDPERPPPEMDAGARQRQIFAVMRRTLQVDVEERPGVTLIEDLHWLDGASEAFLQQLMEAIPGTRSLLVVNFRPEYHGEWMQASHYRQLPLAPLGPEAIRELLDDLLGQDSSIKELAEEVYARTGGNPFFTEEVVQGLVESGSLEGTRGQYRLIAPIDAIAIPETVQSLLASRIDRLGEREKHVLQTAAVIGREFPETILERVADLPRVDLESALSLLQSGEFVYPQSLYPTTEYLFKHALTHGVALGSQLYERRRATHADVARAIEEESSDQLGERSPLIAHHWEEAGEALEASRWHRRAAEWIGPNDPVEGLSHWAKIRALTGSCAGDDESDRLRLLACQRMSAQVFRTGATDLDAILAEGEEIARRVGDREALVVLAVGRSLSRTMQGDQTAALREAMAATDLAADLEAGSVVYEVVLHHAYMLWVTGSMAESVARYEELTRSCEGDYQVGFTGHNPWCMSYMLGSLALAWVGDLERARKYNETAIRLTREGHRTEELGWTMGVNSEIAWLCGEHRNTLAPDLERSVHEAHEIAERLGSAFSRATTSHSLSVAHLLAGRWDAAIEVGEWTIGHIREHHTNVEGLPASLIVLSQAYLGRGDIEASRQIAEKAIETASRAGSVHLEAMARCTFGRSLLTAEGADARSRIESEVETGRRLIEQCGARGVAPQLTELEARLLATYGDPGATAALEAARTEYEAIGATGHASRITAGRA